MTTWRKLPEIYPCGDVGGDWQRGEGWNVRYVREGDPVDGKYAIVDENYYVEVIDRPGDSRDGAYVVTCQTMYAICTDIEDPGGSELWCDYEYDGEDDVRCHATLEAAEASAKLLAESVTSDRILWDGLMAFDPSRP